MLQYAIKQRWNVVNLQIIQGSNRKALYRKQIEKLYSCIAIKNWTVSQQKKVFRSLKGPNQPYLKYINVMQKGFS